MILLTRLRQRGSFYINPDFIERVDSHVDTVVRLVTGAEYIVEESAEEIARRILAYRCSILLSLPEVNQHSAAAVLSALTATSTTTGAIALESSES